MAHFAQLNDDNIVVQVVVISNDDLLDEHGIEQESIGLDVCRSIFGADTKWVQTSYTSRFRKKYAGIGDKYETDADLFYWPVAPYPSWTLDENYDWHPPVTKPTGDKFYQWDEETLTWVEVSEAGE